MKSYPLIIRLFIFTFLTNLRFFTAILVPFFTEWGDISFVEVSILQSWYMFWIFVFEPFTGVFADYYSRKYSLALGVHLLLCVLLLFLVRSKHLTCF